MNKEEIQEFFKIKIPNIPTQCVKGTVTYFNSENNTREKTCIGRFFDFNHLPCLAYSDDVTNDFDYYSLPIMQEKSILPFADDPGGYFFCFDYRNQKDNPSIVLWIRENTEEFDIVKVADSFEEFINNLKSSDELDD